MNKSIILITVIVTTLLVSGCIGGQNTKENAEAVAQKLAIELQNSNWGELYELFTPELKAMRSKEDFVIYASIKGNQLGNVYLIFDKVVVESDTEAYAYYTASSGVLETRIPPVHLIFTKEGWRVDVFASYFTEGDCLRDSNVDRINPNAIIILNVWNV